MKKLFKSAVIFTASLYLFVSAFLFLGCASSDKSVNNDLPLKLDSKVKVGIMDNGMSYYLRQNSEPENRIVLRLVVKVGSNMEEESQRGLAHFIEHLAFNGTENFEKSEIVDYFERIGMSFGSDLNAYTSFDETVYKLEIPADDPEILQKAILILHDWACAMSFDQEEIDKERGVVTEEWRLRQGLQGRVSDKLVPFLLKDSRYAQRLPIGSMDVIHNITRDEIIEFYKKWYRPDFMSLVAVGDIDQKTLEDAILSVMSDIPSNPEDLSRPTFDVPAQQEKNICLFLDPEQKYEVIQIFQQKADYKTLETVKDYRDSLSLTIGRMIFSQRLEEISSTADSPWLEAWADNLMYTDNSSFEYSGIVPKNGNFEAAFKSYLDECDRILIHGVSEGEVKRIKDSLLVSFEQDYKNRDKTESSSFADSLVSHSLTGSILLSAEDSYNLLKNLVNEITIDEINLSFKKYYQDRGTLIFLQAPDSAGDIPSEEKIMEIWKNYHSQEELQAYQDDITDDSLMDKPKSKAKIKSSKEISELAVKEIILSNGIKIITKQTDFVENKFNLYAYSNGGLYQVKEEEVPSGKYAVNYMIMSGLNGLSYNQFIKKISTKDITFDIDIQNSSEYISGSTTNDDMETLFQIIHLIFANPQFTDEGWNVLMNELSETAKVHGTQPRDVFVDEILEILYGKDDIYTAPLNLDYVNKMDQKFAEKVCRERFANPADFTYIIVGNFDEKKLNDMLISYLGSLDCSDDFEERYIKTYDFPKGVTNKTVYKGLDAQGQVYIGFGGLLSAQEDVEKSYQERLLASTLCSLLDIKLRQAIREDKSGSYGIGVFGGIDGYPEPFYNYEINFGCQPSRQDELTQEVFNQLKALQTQEISEEDIAKLQENYRRGRETNLRDDNWWITRILNELVIKNEPLWVSSDIEKLCSCITAQALQENLIKYLDTENYVSVYLKPEK
ncbi:MAG: insulinase family protein [Treponema sp.]|nr:insulinase family protein [Treponema sp.]